MAYHHVNKHLNVPLHRNVVDSLAVHWLTNRRHGAPAQKQPGGRVLRMMNSVMEWSHTTFFLIGSKFNKRDYYQLSSFKQRSWKQLFMV